MKKIASPTAASKAQIAPIGSIRPDPSTSSTNDRPASAMAAPATVSVRGRWPCRSQSQQTTSTGARYSISSATPTGIREIALK